MSKPRLYSLYRKEGAKWVRISERAYPKQTAIRVYQDRLLAGFFSGEHVELRPIPKEKSHEQAR